MDACLEPVCVLGVDLSALGSRIAMSDEAVPITGRAWLRLVQEIAFGCVSGYSLRWPVAIHRYSFSGLRGGFEIIF